MTAIDWAIVAFTLLMTVWGYAQGLIVGALSLAGFVGGGFLGSRVGPLILHGGSHSPYAPVFALAGAFLVGGILASGLEVLGFNLRRRLGRTLGVVDGVGGAALIACAGLFACWIASTVAIQTSGSESLRRDIQRSRILTALNGVLPPSGSLLNLLARFDPFPQITGTTPPVAPPPSGIATTPAVQAAGRSTVRVLGTACGLGIEGSGWVARSGEIVTNAHVVAGETDTTVQLRGSGPRYPAQAIWFDPHNDVAILRVSALSGARPLGLDIGAPPGTPAAILGYPEDGAFDAQPGRLGTTGVYSAQDAYGQPTQRRITALRGLVRSGNSGGPMVDARGRVVTTIFASTVGAGSASGFGVPASVVSNALSNAAGAVGTGPCAH
jgi:S1-C subfamily serine protease